MGVTKDVNGKESSKRYWAKKFFTLGFWLAIGMFAMWGIGYFFIDKEFTIPEALVEIWTWMMGFAAAVILGTVFERPDPRIKKDNNSNNYYNNNFHQHPRGDERDEEIRVPPAADGEG